MHKYKLLIMTPETVLFDGEVQGAIFPGSDGTFEILANHAPIIAMLKEGKVELIESNDIRHSIHINGGFLEFYHNKGVLLS